MEAEIQIFDGLLCRFDLEGEELYSIKWYKDGDEFYRYIPGDREQQVTVFNMNGVRVDVSVISKTKYSLSNLKNLSGSLLSFL